MLQLCLIMRLANPADLSANPAPEEDWKFATNLDTYLAV